MEEKYVEIPYSKNIYVSNYGNVKKINPDGTVKFLKTYLIGPKNHQELVFSAAYFGTVGYHPKIQLAYVVAYLFLNNTVDYRYTKVGYRDGDPKNCRYDNLFLYEIDSPLTIQFINGCILPEQIEKHKNTIRKKYERRKQNL